MSQPTNTNPNPNATPVQTSNVPQNVVVTQPRSEINEIVNRIMQKVITIALMDDEELYSDSGKQVIKALRKDVKELLLKNMFTT